MGRGRQKAKQTKVARRLKYGGPEPDLEALERELTGKGRDYSVEDDPYAKYADYDPYDKYESYSDYMNADDPEGDSDDASDSDNDA